MKTSFLCFTWSLVILMEGWVFFLQNAIYCVFVSVTEVLIWIPQTDFCVVIKNLQLIRYNSLIWCIGFCGTGRETPKFVGTLTWTHFHRRWDHFFRTAQKFLLPIRWLIVFEEYFWDDVDNLGQLVRSHAPTKAKIKKTFQSRCNIHQLVNQI